MQKQKGFTLLELLIVVVIIGIIAASAPHDGRHAQSRDGVGSAQPRRRPLQRRRRAAGTRLQYAIISPGRDGQFATTETLGMIQNFDCDIIFSNGSFLAYPEGASTSTQ